MKDVTIPTKLAYSISPQNYYELMRGDKHELSYFFRARLRDYLNEYLGHAHAPYLPSYFVNGDNVIFLLNDCADALNQNKDYVKVCDLPLDFFDVLIARYDVSLNIDNAYTNKAIREACVYLKNVAVHLHYNVPRYVLKFPLKGATDLRLEALSYEEFKNMRDFKNKPLRNAFGEFFKIVRKCFNKDFYLEISATQGENVLLFWDCRGDNVGVCYELLRYTEQDFGFLEGKDARVQCAFVHCYATHIVLNNLKQILKGVKNG